MSTHYVNCEMCDDEIGSSHPGYMTKLHPECKPFVSAVVVSTMRIDLHYDVPLELFTKRELEDDLFYGLEYLIFDLREEPKKPFTKNSFPKGGMT